MTIRVPQTEKRCTRCQQVKHVSEFSPRYTHCYTSWCKACYAENRRNHYNLPAAQRYHRKRTYGIDDDIYQMMVFMQGGVCAVCGQEQNSGYTQALFVDHNHETGQIRELLCHRCNYLLGFIEKDRERVKKLVKYLKRHDM